MNKLAIETKARGGGWGGGKKIGCWSHTKSLIATCMALQVGELLNDSNDINKDINWRTEGGLCARLPKVGKPSSSPRRCEAGVKYFSLFFSIKSFDF